MNDATNRAKIAAQLQKNKSTTGERARMKDLALNDWFESPQYNNYLTNSKGINGNELALNLKEEMQTWMNSHPEYREFLSYSDIATATQGTSGNYNKAATQLMVDQQNENQKVGAALSPYATIEDQTRLGFEYNQKKNQIQLLKH